jgi:hypothetical protein
VKKLLILLLINFSLFGSAYMPERFFPIIVDGKVFLASNGLYRDLRVEQENEYVRLYITAR